jgi:hypothetical protein
MAYVATGTVVEKTAVDSAGIKIPPPYTLTVTPSFPSTGDTLCMLIVSRGRSVGTSITNTWAIDEVTIDEGITTTTNSFEDGPNSFPWSYEAQLVTLPRSLHSGVDVTLTRSSTPDDFPAWLAVVPFTINVGSNVAIASGTNFDPAGTIPFQGIPSAAAKFTLTAAVDYRTALLQWPPGSNGAGGPATLWIPNQHTINASRVVGPIGSFGDLKTQEIHVGITSRVDQGANELPVWNISSTGPYLGVWAQWAVSIPPPTPARRPRRGFGLVR